ncbi:MAG: ATP-binding protein [Methylobacteriaceae bacterium]|jgi:predicted AAA+ superfamily ATPase|nr:ATP-binding protein [Methylobacteriaceae bacterium]
MSGNKRGVFQTGEELQATISSETSDEKGRFNRRDFVQPLIDYCLRNCFNAGVGIVFGIRATGKTVGMLQAAQQLIADGHTVAYARFNYNDTGMDVVTDEIYSLADKGITCFFVDEASYLNGFMSLVAEWADRIVPGRKVKIVISGTDSFLLWLTREDALFHRFEQFSTNYMTYSEYKRVVGKSFENYKHHGGLFESGNVESFLRQSIVDNLIHTLDHCFDGILRRNVYTDLLYGLSPAVIYKAVISILKSTAEDSIRRMFIRDAHQRTIADLGTAVSGWSKQNKDDIKKRIADEMSIYDDFRGIKHPGEVIDALIGFLLNIGCLTEFKSSLTGIASTQSNYYFTQNALMSYAVNETIDALGKIGSIQQRVFEQSIEQAAEGAMNETIVATHILHSVKPDEKAFKYRDLQGREIDCVVLNRENGYARLIEVKSAVAVNPNAVFSADARHLYDAELLENLGLDKSFKVMRILVYKGRTRRLKRREDDLVLANIEEFISNCADISNFASAVIPEPVQTG